MTTSVDTKLFHISARRLYDVPAPDDQWLGLGISIHQEYYFTPTHLLAIHMRTASAKTLFEAFALPSFKTPASHSAHANTPEPLPRTHQGICNFEIIEPVLLHFPTGSHLDALSEQHFTFLATVHPHSASASELCLLDVVLFTDGTISTTSIYTTHIHPAIMVHTLSASSHIGFGRGVSFNGLWTLGLSALTIKYEGADNDDKFIQVRNLPVDPKWFRAALEMEFDGFRGRLCLVLESPLRIEVLDYV